MLPDARTWLKSLDEVSLIPVSRKKWSPLLLLNGGEAAPVPLRLFEEALIQWSMF